MTAQPGARLYHGTRRGFTRGGALMPRAWHEGPGTTAPVNDGSSVPDDAPKWVYVTEDLDVAWVYAFHAPGRGAPKVLVVEPHGTLEPDPEHSPQMLAWRCDWASVVEVLKTPTITEQEARDGWVLTNQG